MHDIRAIRENPDAFDRDLARRGLAPLSAALTALDEARKSSVSAAQANQERRNALAMTFARLPNGAFSVEIAREQADGTWLWAIDQLKLAPPKA